LDSDWPPDQTEGMPAQGTPASLKHMAEESFKPALRVDESEINGLAMWTTIGEPPGEEMFHTVPLPA
jgi:hypothetical protein